MKLLRVGPSGQECPALLGDDGQLRDLSRHVRDIANDALSPRGLASLAALDSNRLPIIAANRIGPCIGSVGKIVAVGLNYADHAAESGLPSPAEPVLFSKTCSSLSGPNDPIVYPKAATKLDWEIELGVVIGTKARAVPVGTAMRYVAGYCVVNDISERAWQTERGGQWFKGKGHDGFCPIGPWLVTQDELSNPQSLDMLLEVNGQRRQVGNTANMIFGVEHLVSYVSEFMTLLPGDLITTGTPSGVGFGRKPPVFLQPNDTLRASIAGLGVQEQLIVPQPDSWSPGA